MANKIKIIYLVNARIPTEKAHGIQIMQMCEAFGYSGVEVELVAPLRFNKIKNDPFKYYGIKPLFKITKLFCLDSISFGLGSFGFFFETISFLIVAKIYLLFQKYDIFYSREQIAGIFWKNAALEIHSLPAKIRRIHLKSWRNSTALIVLTNFIKEKLVEAGVPDNKILIAPDGVDLEKFDIKITKEESRQKVGLPQDKKIVLYTGHLYEWKGATALLEAAKQFSISPATLLYSKDRRDPASRDNFQNILFVFVGGTEKDVKSFKFQVSNFKLNNVLVVGHRPHQEIPYWLKAADVLVLPNSAKEKISQFYTSPMKLFEYMASGRPIVASDLSSIREILNDPSTHSTNAQGGEQSRTTSSGQGNAVLVRPDIPVYLAEGIKKVLENPDFSDKISKQAYLDVQNYTWEKRAEKILKFIKE